MIAQNHHGILTLTGLFKPGCVYELIYVETSKCEAPAALWLMSSWLVMIITVRVHGIKYLSIIIDHMAEFKKPIQCHMKARWRERPCEELKVWIPLVNSTYQVISVLLHCFTAGKSHKTGGG